MYVQNASKFCKVAKAKNHYWIQFLLSADRADVYIIRYPNLIHVSVCTFNGLQRLEKVWNYFVLCELSVSEVLKRTVVGD